MNDTDIIIILIANFNNLLTQMGVTDVEVAQNYQPTQQGIVEGRALYIHKVSSNRYGFPKKRKTFNESTQVFDHEQVFIRRPTFQISARSIQDPSDLDPLTAGDLANVAADIMQLDSTRELLLSSGIGIERITDVRNLYEENERDRFEHTPSFDFVLNYEKSIITNVRSITSSTCNIERV